jgi:hypothetical protein
MALLFSIKRVLLQRRLEYDTNAVFVELHGASLFLSTMNEIALATMGCKSLAPSEPARNTSARAQLKTTTSYIDACFLTSERLPFSSNWTWMVGHRLV